MKPLDFKEMFDEYVENDNKTWQYDRNKSLGASEAFGCLRQACYKKHGFEVDEGTENSWGAMRRGDIIENAFIVPALLATIPEGSELLGAGEEQETLLKDLLSATPDGLLIDVSRDCLTKYGIADIESDSIVTEFKSIDPRVNLTEPKTVHFGQVQVQMGLIRELTDYKPV